MESRKVTLKELKRKRMLPAKKKDLRAIWKVNEKVKRHSRTANYYLHKVETDELIAKVCGAEFQEICKIEKRRKSKEWALVNPEKKRERAKIEHARIRLRRKNRFVGRGKYPRKQGSRLSRKVYYWANREIICATHKERRRKKNESQG